MELTPEERSRIEQEERKRLAEEEYRAEVRTRLLQNPSTQPPPLIQPPVIHPQDPQPPAYSTALRVPPTRNGLSFLKTFLGVGLFFILAAAAFDFILGLGRLSNEESARTRSSISAAGRELFTGVREVSRTAKVAAGDITVKATGHSSYLIRVTSEMKSARLRGSYSASGGMGNDIEAIVTTASEYANWANGHSANALYTSLGKKTTGEFDVELPPGDYRLGFSNRFSLFTSKTVRLNVDLIYTSLER